MLERNAVRALLVDPSHALLLIRLYVPDTQRYVWLTPGGGREGAESELEGLKREILEETGQQIDPTQAQPVWHRSQEFVFRGEHILQHETYFWLPTERFEPSLQHNPDEREAALLEEARWWSFSDIVASDEYFAPRNLGLLLTDLARQGLPSKPITVGY